MAPPVKSSRSLTSGEISMAQRIFGSAIRYGAVKIHRGKYASFQPDNVVMAPNGEIYFPDRYYRDDFDNGNYSDVHLFIHEMTHVWQYHLGFWVKPQGLGSAFGYGYNYTIKPGMKLSDFRMEGQANIIADYAMYVFFASATSSYSGRNFGKPAPKFNDLKAVLKNFINNPHDRSNLPSFANPHCIDPASAACPT